MPHGQPPNARRPPDPAASERLLPTLAADLQHYQRQLRQRLQEPGDDIPADPAATLVLDYLQRYGEGVCGHPLVRDSSGRAVAVVARTNNILEQHFASSKQGLRRRLGRAHLGRDLADQPAQAALERPAASDPLPRLERNNRDADLRRRNRAWADDTIPTPAPVTSTAHPNALRTAAF